MPPQEPPFPTASKENGLVYSAEEIARWREGAKKFQTFRSEAPALPTGEVAQFSVGELATLFLREKPAQRGFPHIEEYADALSRYGLKKIGRYVYDPMQVRAIMCAHPDVFAVFGTDDPDEMMQRLSIDERVDVAIARGLVLGYPRSACELFVRHAAFPLHEVLSRLEKLLADNPEKAEKFKSAWRSVTLSPHDASVFLKEELERNQAALGLSEEDLVSLREQLAEYHRRFTFSVYGNNWIDDRESVESIARAKRLKDAFEQSGLVARQ